MDNQDKATFSLDDEEIVEEEVIDRDEEYEDDDYDDEDYDDEEYDDEEYDDEEDYDDGYNDDYYDDRLNKVLDELAELKRGMAPANIQQPPPIIPPQYIYQPTAPPAGSEIVMYNEISRLRDELAKNQNSLEMQKEISRMKEDMMRDQKFAESQYNAEIKRLQDRIDDLLKNGSGPQGELGYTESGRIEGGNSTLDLDKLLSINEAILRTTRDSDAKLQNEIGQLKKQLDELPSGKELGSAVSAVKKAVNNLDGGLNPEIVVKLTTEISALKAFLEEKGIASPAPVAVNVQSIAKQPADDIGASELLRQLYALKTTIGSVSEDAEKRANALYELIGEYKRINNDVHSQTTSYKDKLDALYAFAQKLNEVNGIDVIDLVTATNSLINDLSSQTVTRTVFSDLSAYCNEHGMTTITQAMRDSADRYFELCQKLAESKPEKYGDFLPDLLKEINSLEGNKKESDNAAMIGDITAMLLDEKADKAALAEKANKFAAITVGDIMALPAVDMPDTAKKEEEQQDNISIFNKLAEIKADIENLSEIKADIEKLTEIRADADRQPESAEPTEQEQAPQEEPQEAPAVSIEEQAAAVDETAVKQMLDAIEQLKNKLEAYTEVAGMADALEEIRKNYLDISDKIVEISEKIQTVPDTAPTEREVVESTAEPVQTEPSEASQAMADDLVYIRGKLDKLDDYGDLINGFNELRNEILGIGAPADMTEPLAEQTKNIVSEITTQFDKLYDDLSNVLIESETNIISKISDGGSVVNSSDTGKADILADTQAIKDSLYTVTESIPAISDALENTRTDMLADTQAIKDSLYAVSESMPAISDALENARADILAETQAIKDSLLTVNDPMFVSPVGDAVEQLRADVNAFIDQYTVNVETVAMDRQRLMDDVSFLREQAELAMSEPDEEVIPDAASAVQDTDKFVSYLDDISSRVALITELADSIAATRETADTINSGVVMVGNNVNVVMDSIATLGESMSAVTDSVAVLGESMSAATDGVASLGENVSAISDSISVLGENVSVVSDNVSALSENIGTVTDNLTSFTDNVTTINNNITAVNDNLTAFADNVTAINDNISAVNDNIAAVNDNVVAVSDNIAAVNDNVSNVSDGMNAVTDSANAAKDAAAATLDALGPISERLELILEKLDATIEKETTTNYEQHDDEQPIGIMADEELIELKDSLNTILDTLPLFPQADDVITTRDNTYAILDSLALMPQSEDVVATRDSVAAMFELVNTLSDNVAAVLAANDNNTVSNQEISTLREQVESAAEDIRYIRETLDGTAAGDAEDDTQGGDVAELAQNIEFALDKLEQLAQTAAEDKQTIIDTVNGIREEIHMGALDENMSAAGMDGETRDALLGEIAEIRERLGNIESSTTAQNDVNAATLENINAQLADLQAMFGDGFARAQEDTTQPSVGLSDENMQELIDGLTAIREKLDAAPEYDTVEEILSLRDDIKAARIVDQDEIAGELESIKNELAAISSGNILDEIRALRDDIAGIPASGETSAATDGEINLVLNEIVSLRDEVFAFKDEVMNATLSAQVDDTEAEGDTDISSNDSEDMGLILDEISAIRTDQSIISEDLDELKDMISRRTTVSADETSDGAQAGGELNVVLDEIINLKNDITVIEETIGAGRLDEIASQVEDIRAVIEELRGGVSESAESEDEDGPEPMEAVESTTFDITPIMEQFDSVNAALDEIRLNREMGESDGEVTSSIAERFDALQSDIDDIKASMSAVVPPDYENEIAELRAEIDELRAENEQLRSETDNSLSAQIADLKDTIRDMALMMTPAQTTDGDTSYAALIEEIRDLKEQVASVQAPVQSTIDEDMLQAIRDAIAEKPVDTGFTAELGDIRDEIAQLRSLTAVAAESGGIAEVAAIRDEIADLKAMIASPDSLLGVAEDVTAIKTDVQTLKDEPDLGVMSEILALRDEFQALREQIEDVKRIAGETDKQSDESLMSEVQSLRDQLFAISMANVNDPASGESNYESYNNIILDELASLRDEVSAAGSASDIEAISDEFAKLQATLDKREAAFEALTERVTRLGNDATNNRILEELASLRTDMSNQRDADLTTLNFMSEMAHLLERQNQYLTQNAGSRITDEIESLKAEIASSDAVAEEVAKLREVMSQSGNATDNETILSELADLREELSSEKPSRENALILDAISRLRDEITTLAEREKVRDLDSDANLSDSLTDLKEQLNEIAGIFEPDASVTERVVKSEKPEPKKAQSTGSKRGRKPGQKNGTGKAAMAKKQGASKSSSGGAKRGRKPGQKNGTGKASAVPVEEVTVPVVPYTPSVDFDAIIDEQASKLGGSDAMSLNPQVTTTKDAMDVADRLAKQVANKLVMEQLVEQLGDGGVTDDRVEEILRDILPQEFTTIAETEASDKVRRLANQLVLNKLRARLNGKGADDDEE